MEDKNSGAGAGLKRPLDGEESDSKRISALREGSGTPQGERAAENAEDAVAEQKPEEADAANSTLDGENEAQDDKIKENAKQEDDEDADGEPEGEPQDDAAEHEPDAQQGDASDSKEEPGADPEGDPERDLEEEAQGGEDVEDAVSTDEDIEDPARLEAITALTQIEIEFATLRDQIHSDQLARFDFELMLCAQGTHPELEAVEERIRERRDKRAVWSQSALDYKLRCIANTTRAMQEHLHQQFLKDRYDTRTRLLQETTREWYQVNDERRAADKLVPEHGFHPERAEGAGADLPVLVAMSRYQGFPAAPEITGATEPELEGDLRQLRQR